MDNLKTQNLINYLGQFVTLNKKTKIKNVLEQRTRYITVVLEDIYQPHNASAVVRSCECFGVQDIHVIESRNSYSPNPEVTMGSNKWIDIIHHGSNKEEDAIKNTSECIQKLKKSDHQIVALTPHQSSYSLDALPLNKKTAFLFGSEEKGLSDNAIENADYCLSLPMYGFTESYNISVSAALTLFAITQRLQNENINYLLNESQKQELTLKWYRRILKKHEQLEKRFHEEKTHNP